MTNHIGKAIAGIALFTSATLASAAPHAHHEHGIIRLDIAIENQQINVFLHSPLDSFMGFERAPRTDAEKKNAANALALLRSGSLLQPDSAADCTLTESQVVAPVLEGKAKEKNGHADLEASYVFECKNMNALKTMQLGFYEQFKHTKKIEAQIATPKGQSKSTVSRKNPVIKFDLNF